MKFIAFVVILSVLIVTVHSRPEKEGYNYPRPSKPFSPDEEFGPPFLGEQPPVDNGVYEPEPFDPSNFPSNNPRPSPQPEIEPETNFSTEEGEDFASDDPKTVFAVSNSNTNNNNVLNQNSDQLQFQRLYHDYQTYYQYFS